MAPIGPSFRRAVTPRSRFTPRSGPGPIPRQTFSLTGITLELRGFQRIQSFLKDEQKRYSSERLTRANAYYRTVFFPAVRQEHSRLLAAAIEAGKGRSLGPPSRFGDSSTGTLARGLRDATNLWTVAPGFTGFSFNREALRSYDAHLRLYYAIQDEGTTQFLGDKLAIRGASAGPGQAAGRAASVLRFPSAAYLRTSARGWATVQRPIKGYDYSGEMALKAVTTVVERLAVPARGIAGGTGVGSRAPWKRQHAEALKAYMGLRPQDPR